MDRGRLALLRARHAYAGGDLIAADALIQQARALSEAPRQPPALQEVLRWAGIIAARLGRMDEAGGHFAASYALTLAAAPEDDAPARGTEPVDEAPWSVTRASAIGPLGATPRRVGGAFMAARDAVDDLADELASLPAGADLAPVVARHLGGPSAALFGVRHLSDLAALAHDARRLA